MNTNNNRISYLNFSSHRNTTEMMKISYQLDQVVFFMSYANYSFSGISKTELASVVIALNLTHTKSDSELLL